MLMGLILRLLRSVHVVSSFSFSSSSFRDSSMIYE